MVNDNLLTTEVHSIHHEDNRKKLDSLSLMSDQFMTKAFEDHPECIELMLNIILDRNDIQIIDVHTQVFVQNLLNRSVRLDIVAKDSPGKTYNVEIQCSDRGAEPKRARYHSSMLDQALLEKRSDFSELPETFVIFITKNDVLGKGLPVYHINRVIEETKAVFADDAHIVYVNGNNEDESPLGRLMHNFKCRAASDMYYPVLAERVRHLKETKEGEEDMCMIFDELRYEAVKRCTLENVCNLMKALNMSAEQAMTALSISEDIKKFIREQLSDVVLSA